jgi:magnesium chelatase family protein
MWVVINLSPAEQKMNGPLFDLNISLGIQKNGQFPKRYPRDDGFVGVLSSDGTVLPVEGMIAATLASNNHKLRILYLPYDPSIPKIDIQHIELIYIERIQDVLDVLSGQQLLPFVHHEVKEARAEEVDRDKA